MIHASAMAWMMLPWFKEREWTVRFPQIFLSAARARLAVWLKIPWVVASRCLSNLQWGPLQKHFVVRPAAAGSGSLGTQHDPATLSGDGWWMVRLWCFDMFWYWNSFWNSELMTSHCTGLDFDWFCPSHCDLTWLDFWFQGCRFGLPITQGISVCSLCSAQGTP